MTERPDLWVVGSPSPAAIAAGAQRLLDDDREHDHQAQLAQRPPYLPATLDQLVPAARRSYEAAAEAALAAPNAREAAQHMYRGPGRWGDCHEHVREWWARRAHIARDEVVPPRPRSTPAPGADVRDPSALF